MTFPPGIPQPRMPDPSLNEVLWRLERLERKLDWIAANATVPLQGAEPRSAEAEGAADLAGSQTNPKAAESLPADLPPAFKPPSAPSAQDQQQPASLQPVASHPAPSRPEVAAKPVDAPAGPVAARVPQAATVPAMNRFADPSTPPQGPLPGSATQVATRASSEGNLGRYLLSIAAALLVVLSAVSLIALIWDQIPDLLKIGGLGVLAVLLVGLGAWLAKAKPRQQVAAATITGTGGALGFIAIIGGVLLHGVIPTYPAFALMVLWSFALLLVSGFVKQVFSAVVSMVGAIITIGFAAWHASTKPESALVVWTLVAVYLLGLGIMTVLLSRRFRDLPWAAWYPSTARATTSAAVLATPLTTLLEQSHTAGLLVALVPVLLVYVQTVLDGSQLWNRGWKAIAGLEWAVTTSVAAVFFAQASVLRSELANLGTVLIAGVLVLHALAVTSCALPTWPQGWLQRIFPVLLATTLVLDTLGLLKEPRLAALVAILIVPATIICARQDHPWASAAAGAAAFLMGKAIFSETSTRASALAGAVILVALALVAEGMLPAVAPRSVGKASRADGPPAGPNSQGKTPYGRTMPEPNGQSADPFLARPQTRDSAAAKNREAWLQAAKYLIALALVTVVPLLFVGVLRLSLRNQLLCTAALASVLLLALVYLGLFSSHSTPLGLLQLRFRGELPGTGTPAQAGFQTMPAGAVFAVLAQAIAEVGNLAVGFAQHLPGKAVMVLLACGLAASAIRFLIPWIRSTGAAMTAALIGTSTFILSVRILAGSSLAGVLTTVTILVAGAASILFGFKLRATAMRHYGLGLVLLSVFKLALLDLATDNSITRVLALLGAGIVCFLLSLAYNKIAGESDPAAARPQPMAPPRAQPGRPAQPLPPAPSQVAGVPTAPGFGAQPGGQPVGQPPAWQPGAAPAGPPPSPQGPGWYPPAPRQG